MIHWQPAPRPPTLSADGIHVWRLPATMPPETAGWLDAPERARIDAMADSAARARMLATRAGLRRVLAGYLGCDPAGVALDIAPGGKPRLAAGPEFNLSHTGDLALLAVAARPVGIDVERRRVVPRALAIARRVFDDDTVRALAALNGDRLDAAFLAAWTALEARQKCLGEGVFGRTVPTETLGGLAFEPDPTHLGHLAWACPEQAPRVHWFTASP